MLRRLTWRPHRRLCFLIIGILLLISGGIVLYRQLTPAVPPTMTPVFLQEPLRLTRTVTLHPAHTQAVTAPVTGRVDGAIPAPGTLVREGDVLLTVLTLTTPPPAAAPVSAAPALPNPVAADADSWLAAGIITPAEHTRLVGSSTTPAVLPDESSAAPTAIPLTAPMTGHIGNVYVESGGPLIEGRAALTVQATDILVANLAVPAELVPFFLDPLAVRMTVTMDGNPVRYGELTAVDNSTPDAVIAKLRFANDNDTLPVGTACAVTLTGTSHMTVVRLPLSARIGERTVKVVTAAGIVDQRYLVTAYTTPTEWVVLGGLADGDRVITDTSDRWQVGMKVES